MAKFCTNCGKELVEGANVCGYCGTFINNGSNSNFNNNVNNMNNVNQNNNTDVGLIGFIISLISTFLCCGAFNTISLVLSIIGLVENKKNPNNNKALAIAGIVISSLGFLSTIIYYFFKAFYATLF